MTSKLSRRALARWRALALRPLVLSAGALPTLAAPVASLLTSGVVLAAPAESTLKIEVTSRWSPLSPTQVEAALRKELAREGTLPDQSQLRVQVDDAGTATVSVHREGRLVRSRSVRLPEERGSALETLALLGASLVRQDAAELAAALGPTDANAAGEGNASEASWDGADAAVAPEPSPTNGDSDASQSHSQSAPAGETPESASASKDGASAPSDEAASSKDSPEATSASERDSEEEAALRGDFPVHLSFFHPIAIHPSSHELRVNFELGLLYSSVGAVDGLAVNPFALRIAQRSHGLFVSGLWLEGGGPMDGLSVSGVAQLGRGDVSGASVSGVYELRQGSLMGLQAAGAAALVDDGQGALVAGVFHRARDVAGLQTAGVVALARDTQGLQVAGVFGQGRALEGAQMAGGFAQASDVKGWQLAGGVTAADDVVGLQTSSVTLAENVEGAQIGVVNVGGRVRGTQIGVVNVAREVDGFPVGLVNAVGNGRHQAVAWYGGSRTPINVGFKYLHGPIYTLLAFGVKPESDRTILAPGAGIGARIPLPEPLFIEADGLWQHETIVASKGEDNGTDSAQLVRGRAAVGAELLPWLSLFVGGGPLLVIEKDQEGTRQADWEPHFFAGVQVL